MILVDTPIWSEALRKGGRTSSEVVECLKRLIHSHLAVMIGPIRQELLSGIKESKIFEKLRIELRSFSDGEISTEDYEVAAHFFNLCRSKGIQGSNTDFLICAFAARNNCQILTTDKDFKLYATILPIKTLDIRDISL